MNGARSALWTVVVSIACVAAGCEDARSIHRYELMRGDVTDVNVETGEIEVSTPDGAKSGSRSLRCICTKDTEIYVNGRFVELKEVLDGDSLTMVGYHEASSDMRRFVASEMRVRRAQTPAELPDFLKAPNSQEGAIHP